MTDLATRLAQSTLALCRIRSPIGEEKALADHVEGWARAHFAPSEVFRLGHSFVLGNLQDPRPTVAFVGHLDTVPAHPEDREPRIEGERVFGLGASDMKGGLAVMMALAEDLPRAKLPVNLVWVLYEREEGPYLESGLGPLFDAREALRRVKFGIAMEPTDGVVQVGCVGTLHANLRFQGRSAHSARPWQGENAIHKAGPLLAQLLTRPRREVAHGGFTFYEVMSITKASGGRARNVVPESFELNLNYRFAPGKTVARAQEEVRELVGDAAEVSFTDLAPSGRVCADNPLFQRLMALTGLPAASKQAWTDVARFSEFGVDAVNFGPGETAQAHQANESAPIPALALAHEKLALFLTQAG
ncbi:succinyl-diaminopimelate desuccinylase [Melittangium boletus]|uniref:Succinyl-diaminopimelate desuccinylase n=1 Tax=Melittangium boletus DSM 14713 TaxID=1294270 RepID=A0A250IBE7_9BACT|nr:succinyl-diaminopimelate desuccinylase [Melittangium boletus]ATB29075.1 succinyl-diaminopimelate desuccinylase [Melittangium boletus DSM 14713]